MHAKIESKGKSKKKSIALQQSSNYKTIKQRGKKDNPILKLSLRVRLLT